MRPRAVLFDLDGVLADTENVHVAAWERTFEAMGWDVSPVDCGRAAESEDRAFLADLFARRGVEGGDVEGWVRRKRDLTVRLLADWPRLYRGVPELVARLRGHVRLAVVSDTWRENVAAVLRSADLEDAFALVVGKEDAPPPKPDPACYREALRRLKVAAGGAVALEDSPTGLAAARAAGVRCVAVGHRRPQGDWAGDAPYLPDLADAEAVLRALGLDGPGREIKRD
jgi:beta-phosphoglucomutase